MSATRRTFLSSVLSWSCLSTLGCSNSEQQDGPRIVSLGAIDSFKEGATLLALQRVVVHRDSLGLSVVSNICTHQTCVLDRSADDEIVCPCHGSRFDKMGKVLQGPASSDLPWFRLIADQGVLKADLSERVAPDWRLSVK